MKTTLTLITATAVLAAGAIAAPAVTETAEIGYYTAGKSQKISLTVTGMT